MTIPRRLVIPLAAFVVALAGAAPAFACEPYTYDADQDGYRLAHRVQWAFAGDVVEDVPNADTPGRPLAVVLRVRDTFVGDVSLSTLRIEQDAGCDGFWYEVGDRVIAAIGRAPGLSPPFRGITNYQVAVWVIRDGTVDPTVLAPYIDGRSPRTERELRAELAALPDTATLDGVVVPPSPSWALALFAVAATVTSILTFRRIGRKCS